MISSHHRVTTIRLTKERVEHSTMLAVIATTVRRQGLQCLRRRGARNDTAGTRLTGDDSCTRRSVAGVEFSYRLLATILVILLQNIRSTWNRADLYKD